MNAALTLWAEHARVACGRFIPQALAIWGRAIAWLIAFARLLLNRAWNLMDRAQQLLVERIFERRMAVRAMFLTDPRDPQSAFTSKGRKVLAYWAKHAHAFAPVQTNDAMAMAKAEGKRELFALILADIFDDLPNLARMMAAEEARQAEEIVNA